MSLYVTVCTLHVFLGLLRKQIHYTNPEGKSDIVDSSGMWFQLAPKLRKYDAGYLITGPTDQNRLIKIPPQVVH